MHLAPKRTAFCTILHYFWPQTAPKGVQMPTSWNKYSFCRIHTRPLFSIKTNLRENRFFAASWAIGDKMGTHDVVFFTENITFFALLPRFSTGKWGWILDFSVSLFSTSYLRGVFVLVLYHKDNILLSILVYNRVLFALVLHHKDNILLSIAFSRMGWRRLVLHHKDKYSYQYWFTIGFCSPCYCITRATNASQLIGRLEVRPFLNLKIY